MTDANQEPKTPDDAGNSAESEANAANTTKQPEELVRRKVVPPPADAADKLGDDRSPGGSGRGLGPAVTATSQTEGEQLNSDERR